MKEEVYDAFRRALEFGAQLGTLGGDADRTVIGMACSGHQTTFGNEGCRAERELIGTKHRRDHHISANLQTAVDAQPHAPAQAVYDQRLLGFRQPKLPVDPGILYGGQRRSSRATGVSADLDYVGTC